MEVAQIAKLAVEAAVEAIEANGGMLVVPIRFHLVVKDVPAPSRSPLTLEEPTDKPSTSGARRVPANK